jgi:glutamyl-tRNA synthetase
MSKRSASDAKGGAASIYTLDLKEAGYLPEAVINWLALMGWAYDDHTEFFTLPDLIEKFSIAKMNPSPAAVNYSKLDHFNGLHIRALAEDDLARRLLPYFHAAGLEIQTRDLEPIVPLIQERIRTLDDAVEIAGFFFRPEIEIEPEALTGKDMTAADSATALRRTLQLLQQAPAFEPESLEADLRALAQELGLKPGQLFGILRIAVTGQKVSPPLIESMVIVGKATVLERIETAAQILERSI